jgi:hypothetical protein
MAVDPDFRNLFSMLFMADEAGYFVNLCNEVDDIPADEAATDNEDFPPTGHSDAIRLIVFRSGEI